MTSNPSIGSTERHRGAFEALQAAILAANETVTSTETRRAAADREDVPEPFVGYVDTIHDHAYQVTDRSVSDLRAAGAGEDEVFEVTVSAAFGAARARLEAGLAAVRDATRAT